MKINTKDYRESYLESSFYRNAFLKERKKKVTWILTVLYCLLILTRTSNLNPSTQLSNGTKFVNNHESLWWLHSSIEKWKQISVRSFLKSLLSLHLFFLSKPLDLLSLFFKSPHLFLTKTAVSTINVHGFISFHTFLGHKHTISDETLIIFLLLSLFSSSNFPVRSLKKYAQLLLLRGDKV